MEGGIICMRICVVKSNNYIINVQKKECERHKWKLWYTKVDEMYIGESIISTHYNGAISWKTLDSKEEDRAKPISKQLN